MRHRLRFLVAVTAGVACFASVAPIADASFPGRNGKIVYAWLGESAYRAGPAATSIRAVDPRSGRVRVLRDCPLLPPGHTDCAVSAPRYSPDGRRIAFLTARILTGQTPWQFLRGLGTMAADGTGFQEQSTGHKSWGALAWSPTGERLLVQRGFGTGSSFGDVGIFLASLDGTELSQAAPDGSWTPDWSSTGQIAFALFRGPSCSRVCFDVYLTRLGGSPRRLTYRGGQSPSWSPDGTKLAFVRTEGNRQELYVVQRNGRGLRRITRRGGYSPSWSPDGKWMAFLRYGDIYVVRSTGGGVRRLVNAPSGRHILDAPTVSSLDWQPLPARR